MVRNKDLMEKLGTALEEIVLLRASIKDIQSELDGMKAANAETAAQVEEIHSNMDTIADAVDGTMNAVSSGVRSIMDYTPGGGK